ncbi:MAG: TonB-dependent receptor [Hyphomonadaceae bacterium]
MSDGDEEIVVTGTRLRGQGPSPLTVIDREAIVESGASTVTQILRSLPQNFGGGPNETTRSGDGANNLLQGSSINLRGLGADSTLVLINGRRVSTTGTANGLFVDVSTIPVSAIERIDVLTDGASAIYGSDAIGGVINFIIRDDFHGAETSVRYGAAYDGEAAETGISQVVGWLGERARIFAVYDYYTRSPLANSERAFAANSDLRPFGGSNFSLNAANPATVVAPILAGVPLNQDGSALTPADFILGQPNLHNNNEGQDVLGEQERDSLYVSGAFELLPSFELFAELRGAERSYRRNSGGATSTSLRVPSTHPNFVQLAPGATSMTLQYNFIADLGPIVSTGGNESLGYVVGARAEVAGWDLELTAISGRENGSYRTDNAVNRARLNEALGLTDAVPDFDPAVDGYFNPLADGSNTPSTVLDFIRGWAQTQYRSQMDAVTFEASADLFDLPAGAASLAWGAEYREESYGSRTIEFTSALAPTLRQPPDESRNVLAYFAEARVPVIAPEQDIFGFYRLDLSLAARHEDTSNGGADTTPKIGLTWSPFEGLTFRSAWGESFKSPSLTETVEGSQAALVFAIADPMSGSGTTTTLILQGTNPDLRSERAETWTAGFTLRPPSNEGFSLDLNWFRIDFQDRIATPANPFTVLTNPTLYEPIIVRDPDDALVQSYFDAPFFIPLGPTPPASDVGAIVDARLRNLSRSMVSGIDMSLSQRFDAYGFEFNASFSGSYLFSFEQAFSETGPVVDLVDTANNPIDLRLRASLGWQRDALSGTFSVNYADDYRDPAYGRRVDSWTTVDASLGYRLDDNGVEARLNVRNLFNEAPPFLNNPIGIGYDPENADPLGRFISVQISKTW